MQANPTRPTGHHWRPGELMNWRNATTTANRGPGFTHRLDYSRVSAYLTHAFAWLFLWSATCLIAAESASRPSNDLIRVAQAGKKQGRVQAPPPTHPPLQPVDIAQLPQDMERLELVVLIGQSSRRAAWDRAPRPFRQTRARVRRPR